ncbi:MAG: glycerol-3-phosphate dehydrogenase [Rhodospirillaceae bacterium]|nr:glycerol-3-phosphate dehydrogenase [Rhodospirillaceae bacterium]MBT6139282.1 glycerol-3-phosphate dehydrogenase [Rhodospirillaceae bacterium]
MSKHYDIAVIGGGINGCGIARDAAGRGLSVLLCEQNDLASGTSSASTKLIHGGLRYLEHYEFRLVRAALFERETLWRMAPHIIRPLRFVLPRDPGMRPAWLLRLGLFLYDHLGGRKLLPGTRALNLSKDEAGQPLEGQATRAFEYSDCWVDDARLVVLNAVDAAERGATIRTRTRVEKAWRKEDHWELTLRPVDGGPPLQAQARILINAAGPWAGSILDEIVTEPTKPAAIRLVRGSHIIVPRLFEHERAYIFQNDDQRIVFAIPYEGDFTLVGTTDIDHEGTPGEVEISTEETDYLVQVANNRFKRKITTDDVLRAFSGVRPLYGSAETSAAQEVTRDYTLRLEVDGGSNPAQQSPTQQDCAPLLSVLGGKITTYRKLAEQALDELQRFLPGVRPAWTAFSRLPGGEFPVGEIDELLTELESDYSQMPKAMLSRMARAYGTRTKRLLNSSQTSQELGHHFGADLYQNEIEYLIEHEWAVTADDILWRRTKLGLHLDASERGQVAEYLQRRKAVAPQSAA